jgi:mRNA deadenylase 3'-5' endonuclease subunit Ccr4
MLRILQYNVLCSHLSSPKHFLGYSPEDLDPDRRLERLKAKLSPLLDGHTVITLQEVSRTWYAQLIPFLETHCYTIIHSPNGYYFNDYMGCAILVPQSKLITRCEIRRVGDVIFSTTSPTSAFYMLCLRLLIMICGWFWFAATLKTRLEKVQSAKLYRRFTEDARRRENTLIYLEFGDQYPALATYHMPCAYKIPEVMELHVKGLLAILRTLRGSKDLILSGDFNLEPNSPLYQLILEDFQSAYHPELQPSSTCFSVTANNPKGWSGWIDHIFVSSKIQVSSVIPVPNKLERLLPNADEPSDHIMIGACIKCE